jgi:hypothetical protein
MTVGSSRYLRVVVIRAASTRFEVVIAGVIADHQQRLAAVSEVDAVDLPA